MVKMDEKVRDRVNILNKHRDKRVKLTRKLEELRTKYDEQVKDAEEAAATDAGESVAAQVRQMVQVVPVYPIKPRLPGTLNVVYRLRNKYRITVYLHVENDCGRSMLSPCITFDNPIAKCFTSKKALFHSCIYSIRYGSLCTSTDRAFRIPCVVNGNVKCIGRSDSYTAFRMSGKYGFMNIICTDNDVILISAGGD